MTPQRLIDAAAARIIARAPNERWFKIEQTEPGVPVRQQLWLVTCAKCGTRAKCTYSCISNPKPTLGCVACVDQHTKRRKP